MFWEVKCMYTKLDREKTWVRTRFLSHNKATATANDEAGGVDLYCECQWQRSRKEYNYPGQHTSFFCRFLPSRIFGACCIFHTVCHRVSDVPPLPHYGYLFLFLLGFARRTQSYPSFPMTTGFCLLTQLCLKMMGLSLAVPSQRDFKTPVMRVLLYRQVWLQGFKCSFPAKQT